MTPQKNIYQSADYNDDEIAYRSHLIELMESSNQDREMAHDNFDGATYSAEYENREKTRRAYLEAKKNDLEVRVTTGTSAEKTNSILSNLLNLNFQPNIEAFTSKGDYVDRYGNLLEDLEAKSRELEVPNYEAKRKAIYDEFCTQGTVFVRECVKEFIIPEKTLKDFDLSNIDKIIIQEGIGKIYKYCNSELISGLNVYLGNIKEPFIENQPYVFVRNLVHRNIAQATFSKWQRWENVPLTQSDFVSVSTDTKAFNNWTLDKFQENFCEVLEFFDPFSNNYMVMVNGVLMFPVKKKDERFSTIPLSSILGSCIIPIAKGDYEVARGFAYSVSVPSKCKIDQGLFDEMLKSIVIRTRQSYNPPTSNLTGFQLPSELFTPGTFWENIDPEKIKPLIDTSGVSNAQMGALQLIKSIIDEKSVAPIFQGQNQAGNQTATEIAYQQKQAMQNVGLSVLGVITLEARRTKLRLLNLINTWSIPTELEDGLSQLADEYRTIVISKDNNKKRIVKITDNLPPESQANAQSMLLSKATKQEISVDYVSAEEMRKTIDFHFRIEIVPTPKQDSALKTAQFREFISVVIPIAMQAGINIDIRELLSRYTILSHEDPDKFFPEGEQQPTQQMQPMQSTQQPEVSRQLNPSAQQSISSLINA